MSAQRPSHLPDALTRFRAARQAAVERGRKAVQEARESGEKFDQQTGRLAEQLQQRETRTPAGEPTPNDLRTAATAYRVSAGLPVPEFPTDTELGIAQPSRPADDQQPAGSTAAEATTEDPDDYSQQKIMYRL